MRDSLGKLLPSDIKPEELAVVLVPVEQTGPKMLTKHPRSCIKCYLHHTIGYGTAACQVCGMWLCNWCWKMDVPRTRREHPHYWMPSMMIRF